MEDIQKYVFDPERPTEFKAYKLMKQLIKANDNTVIIDPPFIYEIFNKILFDKEVVNSLWSIPNNFSELSGIEKAKIYVENYSDFELQNTLLFNKMSDMYFSLFSNLFSSFLNFFMYDGEKHVLNYTINEKNISYSIIDSYHNLEHNFIGREFILQPSIYLNRKRENGKIRKNIFYFISKKSDVNNFLIHSFKSDYTSVFITTEDVYKKNRDVFNLRHSVKPILLKKIQDIHLLLDFIERDLRGTKALQPKSAEDIGYVSSVQLKNYFSLESIELKNLGNKKEIYFLGENGDGKTLLLQAMTLALSGNQSIGAIIDIVKQNTHEKLILKATDTHDKKYNYSVNPKQQKTTYEHILSYGVNRFRNDSDKRDKNGITTLFSHEEYLENPVKWLQHLDYKELKGETDAIDLEVAKELLAEVLDKNVIIDVTTDGVTFTERGTVLQFEQLSDGYKSVITWVCDLVARLSEKQPDARALEHFYGIVLVDEIGIFLHPKWQKTIVGKLRNWFPNIQFFFTTHSPIIALGASKDAIFYKVYKENGVTKISEPIENESFSNLMANGILTAPFLFDLGDARTETFNESNSDLDTSDDYLTGKIRKAVAARVEQEQVYDQEEILSIIQEELDNYESPNK